MWEKSHDNNEFFAPNDGKGPAIFIPSRPSRAASSLLGPKPLKAYDEAEADRSWPEDIRGSTYNSITCMWKLIWCHPSNQVPSFGGSPDFEQ